MPNLTTWIDFNERYDKKHYNIIGLKVCLGFVNAKVGLVRKQNIEFVDCYGSWQKYAFYYDWKSII
jgi:hypothetical protein